MTSRGGVAKAASLLRGAMISVIIYVPAVQLSLRLFIPKVCLSLGAMTPTSNQHKALLLMVASCKILHDLI